MEWLVVEAFQSNSTQREMDLEFSERNSVFHVPRLVENSVLDSYVGGQTQEPIPEKQRILQKDRPLTMRVGAPVTLISFYLGDHEAATISLGPHDVRINIVGIWPPSHPSTPEWALLEFGQPPEWAYALLVYAICAARTGG